MRATFAGLNTMVRGIMANQLSLDTTGHNITNAGTEGYSRQIVNLATTYTQERESIHGTVRVGTGVDALSIQRARDVYADIQYRNQNPTQQYFKAMSINYDKLETVFDDSRNLGIENALGEFYQSWVDLSTSASTASVRSNVIGQGKKLSDILQTTSAELQEQIRSQYEDIKAEVEQVDDILEQILKVNKQIVTQEVTGASANDLRDTRDLLVDKLSNYINISVVEDEFGAYQVNSGGVTLINRASRTHLVMGDGVSSSVYGVDYGITDYNIKILESNMAFIPQNGTLKAHFDAIAENKAYIDKVADIANYMLTAFNEQHKQGWDMDGHSKVVDGETVPDSINFYGQDGMVYEYRYDAEFDKRYLYKYDPDADEDPRNSNNRVGGEMLSGVRIIAELEVNTRFDENRGERYIAAATSKQYIETSTSGGTWEDMEWNDRTGDGTNAVYLSELFNIHFDTIIADGKANADLLKQTCILRDLDGNPVDTNGRRITNEDDYVNDTAISKLSINAFYEAAATTLGINAYSVDVNYESMEHIMVQVTNWRDSTSGVDWNEELTNMIKFQKGYSSCARCLTAMDEMLDRLVSSTGVVGR